MSSPALNPLRRLLGKSITTDLKCGQCGYDLRGLKFGSPCPECGTPASGTTRARFTSTLTEAPREYLSNLLLGCVLMLLSGVMMITLYFLGKSVVGGSPLAPLFPVPAALVWALSVWMVTQPRRPGVPENIDHTQEWKRIRDIARWSQLGWVVACVLFAGAEAVTGAALTRFNAANFGPATPVGVMPGFSPPAVSYAMNWIGALAFGGAFLGLPALMIYLALLANWASDTSLAERLNLAALAVAVCFPLWLIGFALGPVLGTAYTGILQSTSWLVSFVSVIGTFIWGLSFIVLVIGVIQGALALILFVNMSRWAMANSSEQAASDRRRSENINRHIREGMVKPGRGPRRPEAPVTRPLVPADAERRGVVTITPPTSDVPTYDLAPEAPHAARPRENH
jgi:hypothetical protein